MSGGYEIKNLYQPGYNSFNLESKNLPAHHLNMDGTIKAADMGMTINPMVADQLGELSRALNQGVVPVEVGALDMKTFDTVPTEHWDEMRRKAELAGATLTLHAPLVDPAGFNQQNGRWDETSQQLAERQLKDVFDKAAQITIKKRNRAVPVTIHAGNYAGSTYKIDPKTGEKKAEQLIVVNRDTGEVAPMKESVQALPGFNEKGEIMKGVMTPQEALESANGTQWRKEIDEVVFRKESADNLLNETYDFGKEAYMQVETGQRQLRELMPTERQAYLGIKNAEAHIKDAQLKVNSVFDKAYQYASDDYHIENERGEKIGYTADEKKRVLKQAAKDYEDQVRRGGYSEEEFKRLDKNNQLQIQGEARSLRNQANAIQILAEKMRVTNPNMFQRVETFAIDKASNTLTNVALHAYDKAKKEGHLAPQISLENLYHGMGFSQGQDLADMTQKTRDRFAIKLMDERNMSRKEAEKVAEDMVGVTFDVGHLNISRKAGFKTEDLVKEAEKVKEYVNKVHLTDNFGYEDTHLPIGMGNVPVKELMEAIGKKGEESLKINEVGGWINTFKTSPFPQILQAAGSPIYGTGSGPTWAQSSGFQQSYSSGFGQALPDSHYGMFGAGFSQLPAELGGSMTNQRGNA